RQEGQTGRTSTETIRLPTGVRLKQRTALSYNPACHATNRTNKDTAEATLMETEELRTRLAETHASSFGWTLACCRRDASEAEEVLQIVYLKVLEGKARFDGT